MKKTILIVSLLSMSTVFCLTDNECKTYLVRKEMATYSNPNLIQETHPTIFALVKELADKAQVTMPRYITVYDAEYSRISDKGFVYKAVHDIKAYVDILGDLHICREILTTLPYEDIEGIVAVAMAEKAVRKPLRLLATGFGSFGVIATTFYMLNKSNNYYEQYQRDLLFAALALSIAPSYVTAQVSSNYLQKTIDLQATNYTDKQKVINGIKALSKVTDSYSKKNILSRFASALGLEELYNILLYPVRAYTDEERIAYIKENN